VLSTFLYLLGCTIFNSTNLFVVYLVFTMFRNKYFRNIENLYEERVEIKRTSNA